MKVLHIQYRMPPSGNACFRLHAAMRKNGIESSILNIENSVQRNNVYGQPMGVSWFLKKGIKYGHRRIVERQFVSDGRLYTQLPIVGAPLTNDPLVREADVIYFHWIAGVITYNEIRNLAKTGKPIIFFMHDMWDFTGGCHYSFECDKYKNGCKNCHILKTDLSSKYIIEKKRLYSQFENIIFLSPSDWLRECAIKSFAMYGKKTFTVNNIVDETVFKACDKLMARKILNLPAERKIISFGCQGGTSSPIKGWRYLQKALDILNIEDIHVLIYGSDFQKDIQEAMKYPVTFLGPIFDETKLVLICNASDVFVSPSLSESYGLTLIENILCNTPVVAFDNTAIGEIVKTRETGYLARNKDYEDLARGIRYVLETDFTIDRNKAYSSDTIVAQHLEIIRKEFGLVP